MIKALSISLKEDLSFFSSWLFNRGIAHKVTEERGALVIWVNDHNDVKLVQYYFQQWKKGDLTITPSKSLPKRVRPSAGYRNAPVTLAIVILSILTTLFLYIFPGETVLRWLTFVDPVAAMQWQNFYQADSGWIKNFQLQFDFLWSVLSYGQWWRLITPIFLHFSLLHIAFNAAMFLFFGQRIESRHGLKTFLLLTVVTAVFSNLVQYFSANMINIFGGLSGVIYGLIGFCWVRSKEMDDGYAIPGGIYAFMIIWLILGYIGVLNNIGLGNVANGAHAGGLIAGMIAGYLSSGRKISNN